MELWRPCQSCESANVFQASSLGLKSIRTMKRSWIDWRSLWNRYSRLRIRVLLMASQVDGNLNPILDVISNIQPQILLDIFFHVYPNKKSSTGTLSVYFLLINSNFSALKTIGVKSGNHKQIFRNASLKVMRRLEKVLFKKTQKLFRKPADWLRLICCYVRVHLLVANALI